MSGRPELGPPTPFGPVAEAGAAVDCGHVHPPAAGRLDESARRLSHQELAVAEVLVAEGHQVESLPERRGVGRNADLSVCGTKVEVKSFTPAAERRGPPRDSRVLNKLIDGAGQADHVVLVANGSGLDPATVRRGLTRYAVAERQAAEDRPLPKLSSVRVLGDGFDLAWTRQPGVERGLSSDSGQVDRSRRPGVEGGLSSESGQVDRSRRPGPDLGR